MYIYICNYYQWLTNLYVQLQRVRIREITHFHPPPRPVRALLQPHPSITGILVQPHMYMQPEPSANDGWNEVVHNPLPYFNGRPTVSLPLPPPPPLKNPFQPVISMASRALSPQQPKNHKALSQEPKPNKGKWPAVSISSDSSNDSSYTIKSSPIKPENEPRKISLGDMHPEISTNEDIKPSKACLHVHKVVSAEINETRRKSSHKEYGF
jgi:hypothetical protein